MFLPAAADKLQLLLELESKHGTLAGFEPALHDVLSYLEMVCIHLNRCASFGYLPLA